MLLDRYLGNKTAILGDVLSKVSQYCKPGDSVFDAFSGSLSVSLALKAAGYRVAATDLNLLSSTFAEAFLIPTNIGDYEIDVSALLTPKQRKAMTPGARRWLELLDGRPGFGFLKDRGARSVYLDLLMALQHLATVSLLEIPSDYARSDFFDAYCPEGRKSAFVSGRGRTGRRSFFSAENAARLDCALGQLRYWHHLGRLSPTAVAFMTSVICEASEKVANTQGTWHDFLRETWDARALKRINFSPPPLDRVLGGSGGHRHGKEEDAVTFAASLPQQKVAYLDPPYNFRQYTAYYHLPNTICRYPGLADPEAYFSNLEFVRGQNMADDKPSRYCSSRTFLNAMRELIVAAPAETIIISYFTGRNHWSTAFDTDPSDRGLEMMLGLLEDPDCFSGAAQVHRVPRTNYASYGGFQARQIDELLLVAKKRRGKVVEDLSSRSIGREHQAYPRRGSRVNCA